MMETQGNSGIVAGGMGSGVQAMYDLAGGRHDNCDNGFGGNGMWLIALLALLSGRRGFGDDGNCGNSAIPNLLNDNNNKNFNSLQDQINWNGAAGVAATNHSAQLEATRDVDKSVCNGFLQGAINQGRTDLELAKGFGNVSLESCRQTGILNTEIQQNRFENALAELRTQAQLAECCCTLRMENMETRFQAEKNTCEINRNIDASKQEILNALANDRIEALRCKIAEQSQQLQTQTIYNMLAPKPPVNAVPVYGNGPIFQPVVSANGFCGFNGTSFGSANGCGC